MPRGPVHPSWSLRSLVFALIVAAVMGCGPRTIATLQPSRLVSGPGPIAMFDRQFADLGTVTARKQGFEAFLAVNVGDRPLLLGPATIRAEQGCGASANVVDDVLFLPPMTGQVVRVAFARHASEGPHRYSLTVPSNDPAHPYSRLVVSFNVDDYGRIVAAATSTSSLR